MATYRIYFRSAKRELLGREEFESEDDRGAMVIAEMLCRTCSDVCSDFELWQESRRVEGPCGRRIHIRAGELNIARQNAMAECEERLRDSRSAIARSRRLLGKLDRLLSDLHSTRDAPVQAAQRRLAKTFKLAIEHAGTPKQGARKVGVLRLKPAPRIVPAEEE